MTRAPPPALFAVDQTFGLFVFFFIKIIYSPILIVCLIAFQIRGGVEAGQLVARNTQAESSAFVHINNNHSSCCFVVDTTCVHAVAKCKHLLANRTHNTSGSFCGFVLLIVFQDSQLQYFFNLIFLCRLRPRMHNEPSMMPTTTPTNSARGSSFLPFRLALSTILLSFAAR